MGDLLSIFQGLLFESPGPLGILFALAGVVMLVSGVNRRKRSLLVSAGILWLLGVGIFISSAVVTTQREEVSNATAVLLGATQQPLNMAAVRDKLSSRAVLLGPQGQVWIDSDKLPGVIEASLSRWPVSSHTIRETNIRIIKNDGQTEAHVLMQLSSRLQSHDQFTLGNATRWRVIWQREPSGLWRVRSLQWVEWMGREPSMGMWE